MTETMHHVEGGKKSGNSAVTMKTKHIYEYTGTEGFVYQYCGCHRYDMASMEKLYLPLPSYLSNHSIQPPLSLCLHLLINFELVFFHIPINGMLILLGLEMSIERN